MTKKEKRHQLVGPGRLWKMKQKFQIDFLQDRGLKPAHRLIDIGCGTLRGGIPIIDYLEPGHYAGVDVRSEVINEAFKELLDEGLNHKKADIRTFHEFSELSFTHKFDFALAFSVLIHMNDQIAQKCLDFVSQNLQPTGVFFANVNIGERKDGNWQGFPIVFRDWEFYSKLASASGLEIEKIDSLKNLGHHSKMNLGDQQLMLAFKLAH